MGQLLLTAFQLLSVFDFAMIDRLCIERRLKMNNFFYPSGGLDATAVFVASELDRISEVMIQLNAPARVGMLGGIEQKPLVLKVFRGGSVVSDGANAKVKIARSVNNPSARIQTFMVYGLIQNDELRGLAEDGTVVIRPIRVRVDQHGANSRMREWARQWIASEGFFKPSDHALCVLAIPYLALQNDKHQKMTELLEDNIGGPLRIIHGLSLHCTATASGSPFDVANGHCVSTWNSNITKCKTSAHFALATDGTLMQIVPCDRVAYAQGEPGDQYWLSVEISNNGRDMPTMAQVNKLKLLFRWVCNRYNVPKQIALGRLVPNQQVLNSITESYSGGRWTEPESRFAVAAMSRGLSCHLWLDGRNGKPCPGVGILSHMPAVVM
jgi:N-acetylmuramoyl-L-alanine amidase